jgi:hypothetical protein
MVLCTPAKKSYAYVSRLHFCGMDLISWIIWVGLTFWIFAKPYDISVQMKMKDFPLDILQKCFAEGQIT